MHRHSAGPVVLASFVTAVTCGAAADEPAGPAKRYAAVLKEYNAVSGQFRKATTDKRRRTAVANLGRFPLRLLRLAEEHPQHPIALRALRQAVQAVGSTDSLALLAWETNRTDFPTGGNDDSAKKIVAFLRREHLRSDKIGPICERMRWGFRLENEQFLSEVLRTTPHRPVRAMACLGLAQFLNERLHVVRLVQDRPELTTRYAALFGKDYLPKLQRMQAAGLEKRIEALFERAMQFSDVKLPSGDTVAARAARELYGIRHLAIGKSAPDIVGHDQDGKRFKLSDYRGKVVLLYFWLEF